jgi:hypothetical protein
LHLTRLAFQLFPHLGEGRRFELAHAFLGQAQLIAQTFQGARIIAQLAFDVR